MDPSRIIQLKAMVRQISGLPSCQMGVVPGLTNMDHTSTIVDIFGFFRKFGIQLLLRCHSFCVDDLLVGQVPCDGQKME
jgi:hypothetical protein